MSWLPQESDIRSPGVRMHPPHRSVAGQVTKVKSVTLLMVAEVSASWTVQAVIYKATAASVPPTLTCNGLLAEVSAVCQNRAVGKIPISPDGVFGAATVIRSTGLGRVSKVISPPVTIVFPL